MYVYIYMYMFIWKNDNLYYVGYIPIIFPIYFHCILIIFPFIVKSHYILLHIPHVYIYIYMIITSDITYIYIYIWVIYIYIYIYMGKLYRPHCDLTGIMVNKGNYPKLALFQTSELFQFARIYIYIYTYIYT